MSSFSNATVVTLYNKFKPISDHRFFYSPPNVDAKALANLFVVEMFARYLGRALELDHERRVAKILAMSGIKPRIPFFLNNQDADIYELENHVQNLPLSQRDADTMRENADNITFARLTIVFRAVEDELKERFRQEILISVAKRRRAEMESMIGRAVGGYQPFLWVNIHERHGRIREEIYKRK